jgi:hypothetical protein
MSYLSHLSVTSPSYRYCLSSITWVFLVLFLVVILSLSCLGGYQLGAILGQQSRRLVDEKAQSPYESTSPGTVQIQQSAIRHVARRASGHELVRSQTMQDTHCVPTRPETLFSIHRTMSLPELGSVPNFLHPSDKSVDTLPRYVHSPGCMM